MQSLMFSVTPKDTLRPIYIAIFTAEYCSGVPVCYAVSFKNSDCFIRVICGSTLYIRTCVTAPPMSTNCTKLYFWCIIYLVLNVVINCRRISIEFSLVIIALTLWVTSYDRAVGKQ